MDDRRFDSLVKALATGRNRRSVLKGLLGLGGAAIVGSTVSEDQTDAARRPTPTPTPVRCPGQQIPVNGVCTCPGSAPNKCGPACCTGKHGDPIPGSPAHTECCDNACCNGTCYGEELCCPTNTRSGGLPPTNQICDGPNGPICCRYDQNCCLIDGCCDTVCHGGMVDADHCCSEANFCPGADSDHDLCCPSGHTCCGRGTNANECIDLTIDGACCSDGECGDPCQVCNVETHTCQPRCNTQTEQCCTDQAGGAICQPGSCCPNGQGCREGQVCCVSGGVSSCEAGPYCGCDSNADCEACYVCNRGTCLPIEGFDPATEFCCGDAPCANDRECCQTGDLPYLCLEAGSVCCETNDDCPTIGEVCNTRTHVCEPYCSGSTPQYCDNNFGIYCIPAGETCCSRAEDCPGDCEYCDDNPDKRYCVQRCDAAIEACCDGSYCYTVASEVCCDNEIREGNCCSRSDCASDQTCCGNSCCDDICCDDYCCQPDWPCCAGLCIDPDIYICCDNTVVEAKCCADTDCGDGTCCDGECCEGDCCDGFCCQAGWPCCEGENVCYDPEVYVCCDGVPVEAECCDDSQCAGTDVCCDGACCIGTCCEGYCCEAGLPCCGSLCYDPELISCCNGHAVESTCCTSDDDCPGACEYCNTEQGYCVACPFDRPQCCTNSLGSTCIGADDECCEPIDCGWSEWGPCLDGTQTRTPDNPPVACGGIPCDPNESTQSCCVENDNGPCTRNSACCSGICQSGTCYASNAGTCQFGQDYCDGGAETCSGDFGCNCATLSDTTVLCVAGYQCQSTCDFCQEGTVCDSGANACCGDEGVTCFYTCPPEGGGCFTAETRIALPDGSSRAIADLAIGDAVLGADGEINRIEAIERPRLGNRLLYAIDGSGFFVTASHPFLTGDGWKSIDPAATAREHGAMQVGLLQIGDRVQVLSGVLATVGGDTEHLRGRVEIGITSTRVERIEAVVADAATSLYNVRLDGNQTYFANDLLVHNK